MQKVSDFDVSIVIVCMNNLKNLYPCLDSIRKYTATCSYEVLVTAYLFSSENLKKVREDFSWVTFIESNEIRGFSENNNLALRQAKGKYCFVVNDDTEMKMDVVGMLKKTIESLPNDVAVVSPVFLNAEGQVQVCGRGVSNLATYFQDYFHYYKKIRNNPYINNNGVFLTRNILGAGFLIKTDLFESIGFFDERYFFSPEDLEVGRQLELHGYKCYVDSNVSIYHYEGMTTRSLSMVSTATRPASSIGRIIYYGNNKVFQTFVVRFFEFCGTLARAIYHYFRSIGQKEPSYHYTWALGYWNSAKACLSFKSPKEVFVKYFKRLKK